MKRGITLGILLVVVGLAVTYILLLPWGNSSTHLKDAQIITMENIHIKPIQADEDRGDGTEESEVHHLRIEMKSGVELHLRAILAIHQKEVYLKAIDALNSSEGIKGDFQADVGHMRVPGPDGQQAIRLTVNVVDAGEVGSALIKLVARKSAESFVEGTVKAVHESD